MKRFEVRLFGTTERVLLESKNAGEQGRDTHIIWLRGMNGIAAAT